MYDHFLDDFFDSVFEIRTFSFGIIYHILYTQYLLTYYFLTLLFGVI